MPQTMAFVCFLKSVVALAGEKKWETSELEAEVKREEKVGVRLREKGMTVDVNKKIIETAHTLRKKTAGREMENIVHL